MYIERPRQAPHSVAGCIAAYAGIHYPITVTFLLKPCLQQSDPGVLEIDSETSAKAIAQYEYDRA